MESFIDVVNAARTLRLCQLSTACAVVYDHLITIDQEVELIWRRRWTLPKFMFLTIRYSSDLIVCYNVATFLNEGNLANKSRFIGFTVQGWCSLVPFGASQVIAQLRVLAIYENSRKVTYFLLVGFFAQIIAICTILTLATLHVQVSDQPVPGLRICAAIYEPHYFFWFWIPICMFEFILFAFALWKGVSLLIGSKDEWSRNSLSYIIFRDNVSYFFVVLMACLANTVVWGTLSPASWEISEGFSSAAYSIMGARLMLNLREAYYQPISYAVGTLATAEFASRNLAAAESYYNERAVSTYRDSYSVRDARRPTIDTPCEGGDLVLEELGGP
ncbi:hypothetical protein JAAARDRAFT_34537 [Jaapia argillacea MUCL 33604]|uniref:DUF6533 domain-containing protein n=1 Tax=Jaapia argillacea MUCL 33604 TaxID=933084 RepID=A0A067PXT3_9AGAM|nr:hypothetical protein JAAARDRAFT_34537 [Jaapia argillacea MUCL 33604]